MIIERRAYARAGLLGNPSDGYFGRTISVLVRNFGAHVILYESPDLHLEPHETDLNLYRNLEHLVDSVGLTGYYGGNRLVKAAIKIFHDYCRKTGIRLESRNFTIRYDSSIPRQVGLAGSSAIIVATFRALMAFYGVEIPLEVLPTLALIAETDELGIKAGLQDRVIQVWEGCVYMDFDRAHGREGPRPVRTARPGPPAPALHRLQDRTVEGVRQGAQLMRIRFEDGDPWSFARSSGSPTSPSRAGRRFSTGTRRSCTS